MFRLLAWITFPMYLLKQILHLGFIQHLQDVAAIDQKEIATREAAKINWLRLSQFIIIN